MRIVADENIPGARTAFSRFGEVETRPGRTLTREDLRAAEVLLVRSVTRIDAGLLEGTPVRFVGSATIGTDHVDLDYLREADISFANAPGCNAEAAAEYVLSAVLTLVKRLDRPLHACSAGIVGQGNVGSRVRRKLEALGLTCLINDPPLADAGAAGSFVPLQALSDCDILTLHVPLTDKGPYRTRHLIDADFLDRLRPLGLLINTARGPVIDNGALLERLARGDAPATVLDVWEQEPSVPSDLLNEVALGTPHIAGYSADGKLRGSFMVYEALCRFLGEMPDWDPWLELAPPSEPLICLEADASVEENIRGAVLHAYDIRADDRGLRNALKGPNLDRAAAFDALRRRYPLRREFSAYRVVTTDPAASEPLKALGFRV